MISFGFSFWWQCFTAVNAFEDYCLLDVMLCGVWDHSQSRWSCYLPHHSRSIWQSYALKMEVADCSKMLVTIYQTTQHHIPRHSLDSRHCENLKSHMNTFASRCSPYPSVLVNVTELLWMDRFWLIFFFMLRVEKRNRHKTRLNTCIFCAYK
jgi:hypothetical protein